MPFDVFEKLASPIIDSTLTLTAVSEAMVKIVVIPIQIGLTIVILWHGFNIIRGTGGTNHLLDVFAKSLRAFLVFSLCLAANAYQDNVVGSVTDVRTSLTSQISKAITGKDIGNDKLASYIFLDETIDVGEQAIDKIFTWSKNHINFNIFWGFDLSGIVGLLIGAVIFVLMLIFGAISTVNLLVADFSLAIIFAMGPLFLGCLAFEATARFFDSWLGAALKYIFLAVVIACIAGMALGILNTFANSITANMDFGSFLTVCWAAIGSCIVLILVTMQAPQLASDMVGGIAVSILGPDVAKGPMAAAMRAMKGGGNKAAKGSNGSNGSHGSHAASKAAGAGAGSKSMGARVAQGAGKGVMRAMQGVANAAAFGAGQASQTKVGKKVADVGGKVAAAGSKVATGLSQAGSNIKDGVKNSTPVQAMVHAGRQVAHKTANFRNAVAGRDLNGQRLAQRSPGTQMRNAIANGKLTYKPLGSRAQYLASRRSTTA
jgi:type IV secretion system protein VirB6